MYGLMVRFGVELEGGVGGIKFGRETNKYVLELVFVRFHLRA